MFGTEGERRGLVFMKSTNSSSMVAECFGGIECLFEGVMLVACSHKTDNVCLGLCPHTFSPFSPQCCNNNSRPTSFTVTPTPILVRLRAPFSTQMIAINSLQRLLDGRLTTFYIVDTLLT